jgi:hypothetical protein
VVDSVEELRTQKIDTVVLIPHAWLESTSEGQLAELLSKLPAKTAGNSARGA